MSDNKEKGKLDYKNVDEHKVCQAVILRFEELKRKRNNYKKYGPIFIFGSGILFLTLMFSLNSKIEFLVIWVASILYCVALMIRAEYRYEECGKLLGVELEENDSEKDTFKQDNNSEKDTSKQNNNSKEDKTKK